MVLSKRVGAILREAREQRKLSIKDVARETNITPKYIEALEAEDYSHFPGETYALGFLRNYSDFLNLDTEHLLNLYRGHQIDLSEAPLRELTRSTGSFSGVSLPSMSGRTWGIIGGGLLVAAIIALFATGTIGLPEFSGGASDEVAYCKRDVVTPITLPARGALPREEQLSMNNALRFSADGLSIRLCLEKIERGADAAPLGKFRMRVNEDRNFRFEAREGETIQLDGRIPELRGLQRPILFQPDVLADVSARVVFETGEELLAGGEEPATEPGADDPGAADPQEPATASAGGDIQVTLQFEQDSFLAWVEDGTSHRGRTVTSGERRTLEAKNRLEIKVGNGGGVRIYREGAPPRIAGPPGRIVNIVYRKVPDPLDPGVSRIEESIEIAR